MNPITLSVINQPSSNTVTISWSHKLIINNRNAANSEKPTALMFEARRVGTTSWTSNQTFITAQYYNKQATVNVELNQSLEIRLFLQTTVGQATSNVIAINTGSQPSAPRNVSATPSGNDITVRWSNPISNGGSIINRMYVEYSIDGGVSWVSQPRNYSPSTGPFLHTFTNLARNNTYICRVIAQNAGGTKSIASNVTSPIYLAPNAGLGDNFLFDKTGINTLVSPWRERLLYACEEWEKHIRLDPSLVNLIISQYPSYRGISLSYFFTVSEAAQDGGVTVAFVPIEDIQGYSNSGWKAINMSGVDQYDTYLIADTYSIAVNTHPDTAELSEEVWRATLVHELGHALGFGPAWDQNIIPLYGKNLAIAGVGEPGNRWHLKGDYMDPNHGGRQFFTEAQRGYDEMFSPNANGGPFKRNFIPLMWNNDNYVNRIAHWANIRNENTAFTRVHPPIPSDIMSYGSFVGVYQQQITPVTVGVMLDLGYVKTNDSPSIAAFKSQVAAEQGSGYSTVFNVDTTSINTNDRLTDNVPEVTAVTTTTPAISDNISVSFDSRRSPIEIVRNLE